MKILFSCLFLIFFTSCFNTDNSSIETERLNQRVTQLEQKMDSLFGNRNIYDSLSYGSNQHAGRCLAVTKKGTQCRRVAKGNGYCWQHGK